MHCLRTARLDGHAVSLYSWAPYWPMISVRTPERAAGVQDQWCERAVEVFVLFLGKLAIHLKPLTGSLSPSVSSIANDPVLRFVRKVPKVNVRTDHAPFMKLSAGTSYQSRASYGFRWSYAVAAPPDCIERWRGNAVFLHARRTACVTRLIPHAASLGRAQSGPRMGAGSCGARTAPSC